MSVWWKKVEFHQGKSNCKAIATAAWCLGQIPGGVSGGKALIFFIFLISLKTIKCRQWHYKSIFMAEEAILVHKQPFCSGERGFHLPPPLFKAPTAWSSLPLFKVFFPSPLFYFTSFSGISNSSPLSRRQPPSGPNRHQLSLHIHTVSLLDNLQ